MGTDLSKCGQRGYDSRRCKLDDFQRCDDMAGSEFLGLGVRRGRVKALEGGAFIFRTADSERVVALATPNDTGARARLAGFISAHARCVTAGFRAEACGK